MFVLRAAQAFQRSNKMLEKKYEIIIFRGPAKRSTKCREKNMQSMYALQGKYYHKALTKHKGLTRIKRLCVAPSVKMGTNFFCFTISIFFPRQIKVESVCTIVIMKNAPPFTNNFENHSQFFF